MVKKVLLFIFILLGLVPARAQMVVDTSLSISSLVNSVLLGNGVVASNIAYTGSKKSIGKFEGVTSLAMEKGIVLTTGTIFSPDGPQGPNNSPKNGIDNLTPGDSDLTTISGFTTFNASVLEFDFIPYSDSIAFDYIFGSEEYMEYVNQGVNDAFGFFISGPGIFGPYSNNSKNIALIPGSNIPVTIDNVNRNSFSEYWVDNGDGNGTGQVPDGESIQYDGFTTLLTAKLPVQCGEVYHIRLAISDAGDGIYDSGVFLRARSFSSGKLDIDADVVIGNENNLLYEGCGKARILVTRTGDTSLSQQALLSYSGSASPGIDLSQLPDTVFFQPGEDSIVFMIDILEDNLSEGTEYLGINVSENGNCNINSGPLYAQVIISDVSGLDVEIAKDKDPECPGNPISLQAIVVGGTTGNTTYKWNTGDTTNFIIVNPLVSSVFTVVVRDQCGNRKDSASIEVMVPVPEPGSVIGRDDIKKICEDDTIALWAIATGGFGPPYTYNWSNGIGVADTPLVSPSITTIYTVEAFDKCGMALGEDDVKISADFFNNVKIEITASKDTLMEGCDSVSISVKRDLVQNSMRIGINRIYDFPISNLSGLPDSINFDVGESEISFNIKISFNGVFDQLRYLKISPANDSVCYEGALSEVKITIIDNPAQLFSVTPDIMLTCPADSVTLKATLNPGNFATINWTGISGNPIAVSPDITTSYWVYAMDNCSNKLDSEKVVVTVPQYDKLSVKASDDLTVECPNEVLDLYALAIGGSGDHVYSWSNGMPGDSIKFPAPSESIIHTVTVFDNCTGEIAKDQVRIFVFPFPSLIIDMPGDTLVCKNDAVMLYARSEGGIGGHSYYWDIGSKEEVIEIIADTSKEISLTVRDGCGQQVSKMIVINITSPKAAFDYILTSEFEMGDKYSRPFEVLLNDVSKGADKRSWFVLPDTVPVSVNPAVLLKRGTPDSIDVKLIIEDRQGCRDSIIKNINPPGLFIPNTFSPNGDQINDQFVIELSGGFRKFDLKIFDRWGILVFSSNNESNYWTGTNSQQDTYTYKLDAVGNNKVQYKTIGHVNLVR